MDNKNIKFIDTCRLLGNYNGQNVYVYNSAKYEAPRIFILQIIITCQNGQTLKNYHYYKPLK